MKTTAKQIGVLLLSGAVLAVVANLVHPQGVPWMQDWSNQTESQALELGISMMPLTVVQELFHAREAIFIDARPATDYRKGHIPGAVSIPFEELNSHFPQLAELYDSEAALVVYCSSRVCDDALLLAAEMKTMGLDADLFIDGFDSWKKHGGRVEP